MFRRSNGKPDSTDDYEDQVVMPRASILRAMADCCAAPMSTAPLDHLPKGSLGGPTENSYVRLMLGKPTVTFPPYPVADAGHSLWIGHKINPMDQSVDARHLASELCTTKVVGDMVSILSACKLKADASVCPLNIDNKVNPADENDDSQYYLSQWLDLAKDMSIENAILAAHDTWIKCLGRKDGELVFDFSDAAFNAATAFGKFVDAFIAKDVGPKPIDANIKRRLGKLLGPAIRAYVQCTRFGLYELNLVMGATCPQEHGIWTKNVMFSHKTTETGDEPSAKRFKFGTEDRHTSGKIFCVLGCSSHSHLYMQSLSLFPACTGSTLATLTDRVSAI
ncbi:MAG: hypothetical protein EBS90_09610 [Betaproteobacteria bacterium]|nr:hypothetical protein [Betaproteobacteria bacterium]